MENEIESRARDFYASYCAGSKGMNYQGKPCPAWDDLPDDIRSNWKVVALRSMALVYNVIIGKPTGDIGEFELGLLDDLDTRVSVWRRYMESRK